MELLICPKSSCGSSEPIYESEQNMALNNHCASSITPVIKAAPA